MQQDNNITLSPVIEAPPIPFTMETLGWKIVFFVLALCLLYVVYKFYLKYKHNAYRRAAVSQIEALKSQNTIGNDTLIPQIMFVIKQTALQTYDRKEVAALHGESWLNFLDEKLKKPFYTNHSKVITDAIYKNELKNADSFNFNEFAETSITWIKKHA
ncbi:DUF4381 domain-containing protein [Pseudotamlana carrageenivorans]|uniref:DUF4381 domain-containing protein n=1 Tax=Pseudotamlana carrageenivorans TaxID=2069432 RepID=A0A2I7SEP8_9FLAO|nr:DUF4381 domain-containing protein [Tamlana carrageenivorans]AUS04367.1 hypothetical protein C1A40_02265 [Tamlana carrageenivorans]